MPMLTSDAGHLGMSLLLFEELEALVLGLHVPDDRLVVVY